MASPKAREAADTLQASEEPGGCVEGELGLLWEEGAPYLPWVLLSSHSPQSLTPRRPVFFKSFFWD